MQVLVLRQIRLLWLFVMFVITPVITLPWNTIGKTIAQQQEDDDAGADDGEAMAKCAPGEHHGRAPRPPLLHLPAKLLPPPLFVAHKERPLAPRRPVAVSQSIRVRLQI